MYYYIYQPNWYVYTTPIQIIGLMQKQIVSEAVIQYRVNYCSFSFKLSLFSSYMQQRMWQQTLQSDSLLKKDSNLLMKVTNVPAYDIQGKPVNVNYNVVD